MRFGGGVFYNRVQGNYEYYSLQQMPNAYRATADHWARMEALVSAISGTYPFSRSQRRLHFPQSRLNCSPQSANMSLRLRNGYLGQQTLEVAYVGTQARHLPQKPLHQHNPVGRL